MLVERPDVEDWTDSAMSLFLYNWDKKGVHVLLNLNLWAYGGPSSTLGLDRPYSRAHMLRMTQIARQSNSTCRYTAIAFPSKKDESPEQWQSVAFQYKVSPLSDLCLRLLHWRLVGVRVVFPNSINPFTWRCSTRNMPLTENTVYLKNYRYKI